MSVISSDLACSLSWLWAALDLTALCPLTLTFIALSDLSRFLVYGHKPVGFGQCLQSALMNEAYSSAYHGEELHVFYILPNPSK